MGLKRKHSRRHGRGRNGVRQRWHRHDRKREREANNAFFEVYREIRDGGDPIHDDDIPETSGNDITNEPGEVPAGGNESV